MAAKIIHFIFLIFFLVGVNQTLDAQNIPFSAKTAKDGSVFVTWLPNTPQLFDEGSAAGYTLTRYDSTTRQNVVLSRAIVPKDTVGFKQLVLSDTALMNYYSTVYVWLINEELKKKETATARYSLLMEEARQFPEVATLLGLAWKDTTKCVQNGRYRYDLTSNAPQRKDSKLASLPFVYDSISAFSQTKTALPPLDFQGKGSLSKLRPAAVLAPVNVVFAVAKAFGDSIVVRFAPNHYAFWQASNQKGYRITRTEILKSGFLDSLSYGIDTIRPFTLPEFEEPRFKADSATIIVAQCLYGKSMTTGSDNGLYQKMTEAEMRFGFTLQAAEKSPLAAVAAGLSYIDKRETLKKGARYLYKIESFAGGIPALIEVDNAPVAVNTPLDFQAKQGDHVVDLSWSFENKNVYNSYDVERSDDGGKTFQSLTPQSLMFVLRGDEKTDFRYTFSDSLAKNYAPVTYRLRGRDAFAQWSNAAVLTTYAVDLTPPTQPLITKYAAYPEYIDLAWTMASEDADLARFDVYLSDNDKTGFKKINDKPLATNARAFTYTTPVAPTKSYYFIVAAVDTANNQTWSFAQFVPIVDSVAPVTPTGLTGKIDTNGIVRLTWNANRETDLLGYRVFFSNNENVEFAQRTRAPINSTTFQDTLDILTLNHAAFYRIVAEDFSTNKSPFSLVFSLKKPDKVAPSVPLLTQPSGLKDGIDVPWIASTSDDVARHTLYRSRADDSTHQWIVLAVFGPQQSRVFRDTTAQIEQMYNYQLTATDSTGNTSEPSLIVTGRRFFDAKTQTINQLRATVDNKLKTVLLSWQPPKVSDPFLAKQTYSVFIYRAKGAAQLEKYQQLTTTIPNFNDDEVTKGNYRYALRIAYADGKISPMSAEIAVNIE